MTFSIKACAARLLDDDPLFTFGSDGEQEETAAQVIGEMGGDLANERIVYFVLAEAERQAARGFEPPGPTTSTVSASTAPAPRPGPVKPATVGQRSAAAAVARRIGGPDPLLREFAAATGMSDTELGKLLGLARTTVNLKRNGHYDELLSPQQVNALRNEIVRRGELLGNVLDKLG